MGRNRFADVIRFNTEALQPDPAHRMPVPTLATLGDHDNAKQIRAQLTSCPQRDPSVRFTMVPNAGHIANLDAADFVNAEIAGFLGWWCLSWRRARALAVVVRLVWCSATAIRAMAKDSSVESYLPAVAAAPRSGPHPKDRDTVAACDRKPVHHSVNPLGSMRSDRTTRRCCAGSVWPGS